MLERHLGRSRRPPRDKFYVIDVNGQRRFGTPGSPEICDHENIAYLNSKTTGHAIGKLLSTGGHGEKAEK